MTTTVEVRFNTDDRNKIEPLLDFVKSLDFVSSVEISTEEVESIAETPSESIAGQFLSIEAIREMYPNEWVLLAEPRKNGIEILGGIVLLHEADKRNMALRARDLVKKHANVTHFFTGKLPKRSSLGLLQVNQS